jgi:hypothetical protein
MFAFQKTFSVGAVLDDVNKAFYRKQCRCRDADRVALAKKGPKPSDTAQRGRVLSRIL